MAVKAPASRTKTAPLAADTLLPLLLLDSSVLWVEEAGKLVRRRCSPAKTQQ